MNQSHRRPATSRLPGRPHFVEAMLALLVLALPVHVQAQTGGRSPARPAPVTPVRGDSGAAVPAPGTVQIPRQRPAPAPVAPVSPSPDAGPASPQAPAARTEATPPGAGGVQPVARSGAETPQPKPIEGFFALEGSSNRIRVSWISGDIYMVSSPSEGWEGVGILEGTNYRGVFRQRTAGDPTATVMGYHVIDWSDLKTPAVHIALAAPHGAELDVRWHRTDAPTWPGGRLKGLPTR